MVINDREEHFGFAPAVAAAAPVAVKLGTDLIQAAGRIFGKEPTRPQEAATTTLQGKPQVAGEWGRFTLRSQTRVIYGRSDQGVTSKVLPAGTHVCSTATFGSDPAKGNAKACYAMDGDTGEFSSIPTTPAAEPSISLASIGGGIPPVVLIGGAAAFVILLLARRR